MCMCWLCTCVLVVGQQHARVCVQLSDRVHGTAVREHNVATFRFISSVWLMDDASREREGIYCNMVNQ